MGTVTAEKKTETRRERKKREVLRPTREAYMFSTLHKGLNHL